jgi:hypothetical protein
MSQFHVLWVLVGAAAVIVSGGYGGVVVRGDPGDRSLAKERYDLVGPGGVPHQIPQMVHPRYTLSPGQVLQDRLEGWEVGMYV